MVIKSGKLSSQEQLELATGKGIWRVTDANLCHFHTDASALDAIT
jgi:hypothetical protein